MKKKLLSMCMLAGALCLTGCAESLTSDPVTDEVELTFVADFYTSAGDQWLSIEGSEFNIEPNKIKEYGYSSAGHWEYNWTTSSVVSIDIDGHEIDTCGNTVIFSDSRLEPLNMEIPEDIMTKALNETSSLHAPKHGVDLHDYWFLTSWFTTAAQYHYNVGPKVIIIRGQTGTPIAMYTGKDVSWEVAENLPTTTLLKIDGKALYIHRAEFSIIDSSLFK